MKTNISVAVITAALFTASAHAVVIQLAPIYGSPEVLDTFYVPKNGTGLGGANGNDSANQLFRLNSYFLDTPFVPTASQKPASQTYDWSAGGLAGWDYVVVHFGAAAHEGAGGSVGAWDLNGMNSFVFPSSSFSSIDFFRKTPLGTPGTTASSVPDGGTSLVLLGGALLALAPFRKSLVRKA